MRQKEVCVGGWVGGWWSRGHRGDKGKKGVGRTRESERGRDGKRGEREGMSERERDREGGK